MSEPPRGDHPHHLLHAPLPFPPLSLFAKDHTVSSTLAAAPTRAPKSVAAELFPKPFWVRRLVRRFFIKRDLVKGREWTKEELDQAAERGTFGSRPSDLFLKMYADVLTCLTRDPLAGNVSPALLGTSGCVPLSIVSNIPDIMRHYHDCIVLAEKEVFLVTNYWQPSDSVNAISNSLRELSKLVEARKGEKIVVKIMWDRGSPKQVYRNHVDVTPETWVGLDLPAPSEVPLLSLQVTNFHRPLLGTFHQKAMVVDRRVAILNSNNIQDRPNVEMMIHLEGPVVDSLYDVLLLSWHETFSPALPCLPLPSLYSPSAASPSSIPSGLPYTFNDSNKYLAKIDIAKAAKAARVLLKREGGEAMALDASGQESRSSSKGGFASLVAGLVQKGREGKESTTVVDEKVPDADTVPLDGPSGSVTPPPSAPLAPTNSPKKSERLAALSKALNAGAKKLADAAIDDESLIDDFKPHFLHRAHEPFPIALVNRKPHGLPGHQDVRVPQDAAWLAGFRYASSDVFIQTPTLNAKPIVRAIIESCRTGGKDKTGLQVTLYLDLGFNDKGESVLFQGGTNAEVVSHLYKELNKVGKQGNLHVYWYTGKDQIRPLNAVEKTRNCHVKFMSIDGQCAIIGNGNQDTQSWFHSQECNILVDSPQIVSDWMCQLRTNQSTEQYGKVDSDGVWRDAKTGEEMEVSSHISCFSAMAAVI